MEPCRRKICIHKKYKTKWVYPLFILSYSVIIETFVHCQIPCVPHFLVQSPQLLCPWICDAALKTPRISICYTNVSRSPLPHNLHYLMITLNAIISHQPSYWQLFLAETSSPPWVLSLLWTLQSPYQSMLMALKFLVSYILELPVECLQAVFLASCLFPFSIARIWFFC